MIILINKIQKINENQINFNLPINFHAFRELTIRIRFGSFILHVSVNVQNEPLIIQPENQFASNKPCFSITNVIPQRSQFTLRCIKSPRDRSFRYVIDRQKFLLDARSVIACTFYPMNSSERSLSPRSITGSSFFGDLTRSIAMYVLGGCVCQWLKHALIKYVGL